MISINLPPFADEPGASAILMMPEAGVALISPELHIGVDTAAGIVVMHHLMDDKVQLATNLNPEQTMAVISCLLNKLYYIRGVRDQPKPPSPYPPHMQRVIKEKEDLDEKIGKLSEFFHSDTYSQLEGEDRALLIEQRTQMMAYSDTLLKRIVRYNRSNLL